MSEQKAEGVESNQQSLFKGIAEEYTKEMDEKQQRRVNAVLKLVNKHGIKEESKRAKIISQHKSVLTELGIRGAEEDKF